MTGAQAGLKPIQGKSGLIAEYFLDTNVLIYAAAGHDDAPAKQRIAEGLLGSQFATSGQVLAEFYANVIKKPAIPLEADVAKDWLRLLSKRPFQPVDVALVHAGAELSTRYKMSYWDGAIIAAAERLGVRTVLSEDLSHGQTYGSVTVLNPFRDVSDPSR